jgi:hypothetical protein
MLSRHYEHRIACVDRSHPRDLATWRPSDSLGRVERIVLADGLAPTGSRVAAEHRIARSTLQDALGRLLADERHVQRDNQGRPFPLDPLLAEWLRRR